MRTQSASEANGATEQLKMAGQVQRNFLPARLPDNEDLRWSAVFQPADWVSGDIYDVARLDEEHIGFYITDAVGHSMPAALLTMFLKQALVMRETQGNEYRIFEPLEVIEHLNAKMAEQKLIQTQKSLQKIIKSHGLENKDVSVMLSLANIELDKIKDIEEMTEWTG